MRARCRRAIRAFLSSILVLVSCAHDPFLDRLRTGCASEADCRDLIAEGAARLDDCTRYLAGNRLRHDRRSWQTRCRYEWSDYQAARSRAVEWARSTGTSGRFDVGSERDSMDGPLPRR